MKKKIAIFVFCVILQLSQVLLGIMKSGASEVAFESNSSGSIHTEEPSVSLNPLAKLISQAGTKMNLPSQGRLVPKVGQEQSLTTFQKNALRLKETLDKNLSSPLAQKMGYSGENNNLGIIDFLAGTSGRSLSEYINQSKSLSSGQERVDTVIFERAPSFSDKNVGKDVRPSLQEENLVSDLAKQDFIGRGSEALKNGVDEGVDNAVISEVKSSEFKDRSAEEYPQAGNVFSEQSVKGHAVFDAQKKPIIFDTSNHLSTLSELDQGQSVEPVLNSLISKNIEQASNEKEVLRSEKKVLQRRKFPLRLADPKDIQNTLSALKQSDLERRNAANDKSVETPTFWGKNPLMANKAKEKKVLEVI